MNAIGYLVLVRAIARKLLPEYLLIMACKKELSGSAWWQPPRSTQGCAWV